MDNLRQGKKSLEKSFSELNRGLRVSEVIFCHLQSAWREPYHPLKTSVSQDKEVETSSKTIYMFEIGEDPKRPIKFMFTKVSSCYTILVSKLVISSVEMRQ